MSETTSLNLSTSSHSTDTGSCRRLPTCSDSRRSNSRRLASSVSRSCLAVQVGCMRNWRAAVTSSRIHSASPAGASQRTGVACRRPQKRLPSRRTYSISSSSGRPLAKAAAVRSARLLWATSDTCTARVSCVPRSVSSPWPNRWLKCALTTSKRASRTKATAIGARTSSARMRAAVASSGASEAWGGLVCIGISLGPALRPVPEYRRCRRFRPRRKNLEWGAKPEPVSGLQHAQEAGEARQALGRQAAVTVGDGRARRRWRAALGLGEPGTDQELAAFGIAHAQGSEHAAKAPLAGLVADHHGLVIVLRLQLQQRVAAAGPVGGLGLVQHQPFPARTHDGRQPPLQFRLPGPARLL